MNKPTLYSICFDETKNRALACLYTDFVAHWA